MNKYIGGFVNLGFFLSTGFADNLGFIAGLFYGPIIEYFLSKKE